MAKIDWSGLGQQIRVLYYKRQIIHKTPKFYVLVCSKFNR